jgi:serine/threonine protein kinase
MASDSPPTKGRPRIVRLGPYEVVAHIATGGMGAVYRARDTKTGQEVALKVLPPPASDHPTAVERLVERFRRESEALRRLRHENIVAFYDFNEFQGIHYLAMEYIDGIDLHRHITNKGRLDPKEASYIVLQAARALHHAFRQGIVHRDIKPSNFLLTRKDGRLHVKLTDLGLARREVDNEEFRLTREGTTVGTVDYMSPEQARDSNSADTRSDIYSLGCTFFHMLTGQAPFPEGSMAERLCKHMEEEAPDVRSLNPNVPEPLAKLVARMLAKDPNDRYQTPKDLMKALVHGEPEEKSTRDVLQSLAEEEKSADEGRSSPRKKSAAAPAAKTDAPAPTLPMRKDEPEAEAEAPPRQWPPWAKPAAAGAAAVLLLVVAAILLSPFSDKPQRRKPPPDDSPSRAEAPPPDKDKPPGPSPPPQGGGTVTPRPPDQPAAVVWPPLRSDGALKDLEQLRRTFAEGIGNDPEPPADAPVYRVSRAPQGERHYATLQEAARAAEKAAAQGDKGGAKQPSAIIIEIQDNGPLYETPTAFTGRDVFLRAAPGYRPLIFWEATGKADDAAPLLSVRGGSLTLANLDFAFSRSQPETARRVFVRVAGDGFFARNCSFSVAGSHPAGVALARLEPGPLPDVLVPRPKPARCRLHRCYGRGQSLVVLDLDTYRPDVLLDECLLVGGEPPLLDVMARADGPARLRLLRSTLCGRACLRLRAGPEGLPREALQWQAWDVVLAHSGGSLAGLLVELPDKGKPEALRWQATNCLYAGWKDLLKGAVTIEASDPKGWERCWSGPNVERFVSQPWPPASFPELATVAAAEYRTDVAPGAPVGYAGTSWPCLAPSGERAAGWLGSLLSGRALADQSSQGPATLGCPVAHLPRLRDDWMPWTVLPFVAAPVDMQPDPKRTEIPAPTDNLYHGERLDVSRVDVGARLEQIKKNYRLAPVVVLRLFRSGEARPLPLSPLRLKDVSLVLVLEPFEKPKEPPPGPPRPPGVPPGTPMQRPPFPPPMRPMTEPKEPEPPERLVLVAESSAPKTGQALIEVEGGSLDIIGGTLRFPDFQRAWLTPYLIRVKGGDLRLSDCRLEGPLFDPADNFRGLVRFEGAGATDGRTPQCAISECVLTSGRAALCVGGTGARLRLERSVLVAGKDALDFDPGRGPHARMSLHCALDRVMVAARRAVVHLGEVAPQPPPADPLVVQSRRCAFLNPFGDKGGLLLTEGESLRQGVLIWQSADDVYDKRLHFAAASLTAIPATAQTHAPWHQLWGAFGDTRPVTALPLTARFDRERWPLERLRLPVLRGRPIVFDPREFGPDLEKLGIIKKPSRPRR